MRFGKRFQIDLRDLLILAIQLVHFTSRVRWDLSLWSEVSEFISLTLRLSDALSTFLSYFHIEISLIKSYIKKMACVKKYVWSILTY